jgi:CRISPR/Cas system-associated protein Csx1
MERIPTTNGVVRCSKAHGANERAENIAIARHFAEKYGHEIDLLPRSNDKKTADAYNRTLGIEQEYKVNRTPTYNAINKELRKASRQASHIVLHILSAISDDLLKEGIKGRVRQKETIEAVTILRNGVDKTYTRAQILGSDFTL